MSGRLSKKETTVLKILCSVGQEGLLGSEIVERSGGMKAMRVHRILRQMEDQGMVHVRQEWPDSSLISVSRYWITAKGYLAFQKAHKSV